MGHRIDEMNKLKKKMKMKLKNIKIKETKWNNVRGYNL